MGISSDKKELGLLRLLAKAVGMMGAFRVIDPRTKKCTDVMIVSDHAYQDVMTAYQDWGFVGFKKP